MMTPKHGPIAGLPDSALNDCMFLTGKRGSGKSGMQRTAMERALSKGLRCGWIDSMGVGWGITVMAVEGHPEKGVGPGYDVVVFGGAHGHMPLSPTAGAALGTMLAKAKFSWVIDLSLFKSKAQRVAFMAPFIEALYENCREQLLLMLDEVDLWAPQMVFDKQGPSMHLLGAIDEIVRRGRIKGLAAWMATQRPAAVSKSVISQADGMLAFKTVLPGDLDAVMLWMKNHLSKEDYQAQAAQLPSLRPGEAVVYLTEPTISIERRQFPMFSTLDTFKPPEKGETHSDKHASKPDMDAIKTQLGTLEETLKADDPKHLRAEIARLKAEAAKKPPPAPANPPDDGKKEKWFEQGVKAGQRQNERLAASVRKLVATIPKTPIDKLPGLLATIDRALEIQPGPAPTLPPAPVAPLRPVAVAQAQRTEMPSPEAQKAVGAAIRILGVLAARYPARFSMGQWAVLANMKKSGGTWGTYVRRLRRAAYIDEANGTVAATEAGIAACGVTPGAAQGRDELLVQWKNSLGSGPAKMIAALVAAYPGGMSRDELAEATNMAASGGTFGTYLSRLNSNLVVVTDRTSGIVRMADVIMEA